MAEAVVTPVVERCVDVGFDAVVKHLGYIWNYKKNIKNLQTLVDKLDKERSDKGHSVTVAVKSVHRIKNSVEGWQKEADKISEDAKKFIEDHKEEGKKRCLMGLCPSLVSRYQLSKRASEKETEIVKAITDGEKIIIVSDPATGLGKKIALSTEGCFTFDSRKLILEDIVKTLQDETMTCVGVYGLGGMGKTTLAKQVAFQVAEEKMFEEVVFASVTQKVDMKEIQGQIASMLDLKLEDSALMGRASLIHERLKGKKVLVVLDDLWAKLDLIQVGIPFGAEHMGCKVLLTSRFGDVLNSMGTRKEYDLGALKEEEAWKLFKEKVGDIVKDPKFFAVGKEVAKKCAGWPILIVTTAASLSKQLDLDIWEDALAQVKNMNDTNMQDIVKSAIKSISYKYLNETHKRLFLLCGLMQGDVMFERILRYSWGWDLFVKEKVRTVEGARKRLRTLISDLKESCLLVDGRWSDHIKMHDVVRDIAISIAKDDLKAYSHGDNDTDLSSLPNDDELNKCTAMVFWKCRRLPCFPQRLECPSLELFILLPHWVDSKPKIPDTFFERTSKLQVLELPSLCFPTLPSTLSFLTNLQSLHLDHCDGLQDISMVGELKTLQELSLIGSSIQALPSSLGQLSELKLLDLNRCSELKVIPAGLISRLSRLEELHMRWSFDRWKSEEFPSNASFAELKHLHYLTCLKVKLRDAKLLAGDLNFENLKRYEIIVGDMWGLTFRDWLNTLRVKTSIALQLGYSNSIHHLQHVVNTLFKRIECLCLRELKGINNVIPDLKKDGFPELKHLRIVQDSEIQYIVDVEGIQHNASFPALESLYLKGLLKVEKICNGRLMEGSFCKLTTVEVYSCNSLESLVSFSTIIALPCLQEIEVSKCKLLEGIVAKRREEEDDDVNGASDGNREKMMLTIRRLTLRFLPKFMTFFYKDKKIPKAIRRQKLRTSEMESQEIISEEVTMESEDESASSLPLFEEVSFPELEELVLSGIPNLTKIWSHKLREVACCNLTTLEVSECHNLKYLFTLSHARVLVGLQRLAIRDCSKMKQVVAREEGETETETVIFPLLSSIELLDLPNLTMFYSVLVEETTTREKVETFTQPLFDEKVQLPSLKILLIEKLDSIGAIWASPVGITQSSKKDSCEINLKDKLQEISIFQNLSEVTIIECKSLKFVFLASVAPSLNQMTKLSVQDCGVETMTGDKEGVEIEKLETGTTSFALPKVFSASVARSLNQLMKVCVPDCAVETMTGDKEDVELEKLETGTTTFTLPKLVTIYLQGLPKLECFYPKEHTIEWPALKALYVVDCGKLFVLDLIRCYGKQGDDRIIKVIPSLKSLGIGSEESSTFLELADLNIFDRLEDLRVTECPRLINLAPFSISFKLLKRLEISDCGGLINLLQPSAAKSLEQLEHLIIRRCEIIEEIIGGEGREDDKESSSSCRDDEIIFNQLLYLRLYELPSLTHFCSSQYYTFNFPKLTDVDITECPNMKTFCGGIATTPQLKEAYLDYEITQILKEGLNKTLEKNYEKLKEAQAQEEREAGTHTFEKSKGKEVEVPEAQAQEERVDGTRTFEKSEGKEVEVSEQAVEHFENSEALRYSDPSCSNYTASSPQLSPQISNNPDEVSDLATQVEAHTPVATVSTTLPGNQFEAQTRIHEMSPEKSIEEPEKEIQVPTNCIEVLENKEPKVCENATTGPRKEAETCDQVVETLEAQGLTITVPSTSSSGRFEQDAEKQEKSIEELTKPANEGLTSMHANHEPRMRISQAALSSQQRDLKGSCVAKDSISLDKFVHILQTQAVNNVSAEQVEFVEDAIGQFRTYVDKAKECLKRKKTISELKLRIQVLEDENDVVASAAPRFG